MKRGRSQVIWRYTPGSTFRYNESGGWCLSKSVTLRDPAPLQGALAKAIGAALHRWQAIGPTGFPDPLILGHKYAVGEPYQVMYSVWPTVFTCRNCGKVHFYQELSHLVHNNQNLRCRSCNGRDQLRQVPFAYVCECGRLDSVYIPKHNRNHTIDLVNKGSFQESFWRCKDCGVPLYRTPREGLGFRRCECAPGKGKRGILLEDSRIYYSQTVDLVEIEPRSLDRWKENVRFSNLLLGAVLRISAYRPSHILDLASWKPSGAELSPDLKAMRALLLQKGMSEAQADEMVQQAATQAGIDPWAGYDRDLTPLYGMTGPYAWNEQRQTVEYVFVRDEPSSAAIPLSTLIDGAQCIGDSEAVRRLKSEQDLARQLGIINLQVVQALPILLAGIGFSRYFAGPRDATQDDGGKAAIPVVLRPYELQGGKIPIYIARNRTEALLYEIDPWRLAAFVEINAGLNLPNEVLASDATLRAWLLGCCSRLVDGGESHFVLQSFEKDGGVTVDEPSALAFGVLHSISHVLKATAHRYVGIDADALAEYLFPAHSAGLLYASTHVEFTLGGIDAAFRSNLTQWLGSARDYAGRCSFDPVCAQSGGACLACLYPKFGCAYFNRTVSRSFLLGGHVPGRSARIEGFWEPAVVDESRRLQRADHSG